jgi:ADP-ribose pyrophosphatase
MDRRPEILGRKEVYRGRKIALEIQRIRGADGREADREVVRHGGAVVILAFPEPGKVLMERIWRYAVEAAMFEIPAGTLEPGEDTAACAARELAEETGYRAARLEPLMVLHPSPGILGERMTVFLAEGLQAGEPDLEPGEEIETLLIPIDDVLAMIRDGRITDAKTVASLLFWQTFRKGRVN